MGRAEKDLRRGEDASRTDLGSSLASVSTAADVPSTEGGFEEVSYGIKTGVYELRASREGKEGRRRRINAHGRKTRSQTLRLLEEPVPDGRLPWDKRYERQ